MREYVQLFIQSIKRMRRRRLRSFLVILSIAIGTASVVIISSIGVMGKQTVNTELDRLGINGLMITANKKIPSAMFTIDDLLTLRECVNVSSITPIIAEYTEATAKNLWCEVILWGVDKGAGSILSITPGIGRSITGRDVSQNSRVCVISEHLATLLYGRVNIIGKPVKLLIGETFEEFEIIGITKKGSGVLEGIISDYAPTFIYVPYTTLQYLSGRSGFERVAVKLSDNAESESAGQEIISLLEKGKSIKGYYSVEDLVKQKEQLNGIFDIVTVVLSAIASISLVVAGLGIMTSMLVTVSERTHEIGIKKAVGATNKAIKKEFLTESFTISFIGGLTGVMCGIIAVLITCVVFAFPFLPDYRLWIFCILFTSAVGTFFGVYPASRAARLDPVEALRRE